MKRIVLGIALIALVAVPFPAQAVGEHNVGTNIIDKGTVYRIEKGLFPIRAPYTSAGAFLSYKFNTWNTVVQANPSDLALEISKHPDGTTKYIIPRPGSLINDNGTVYLITQNNKAGFTSEAVFKGLGYSYNNVYTGDTSFMMPTGAMNTPDCRHPMGTLVNASGTLYIMLYKTKVGVPSMAVLDSWGYWPTDAVTASSFDSAMPEIGVLNSRTDSELTIMDTELWQMDLELPMPNTDTLSVYSCWKS